ncbi:MAG: hypothetical protein Q4E47_03425 [Candidatus Saccharibacteria bacterium]|nr:hypothetical protein [Candidatus Saccharibacteria bacterium]
MANPESGFIVDSTKRSDYVFKFLSYYYDKRSRTATFCYQGIDNFIFTEKITFAPNPADETRKFNVLNKPELDELLDRAVFLAFILIGTSYFKAHPTPYVRLDIPLDDFQAKFFSHIYQEGLSQYAFENHLTRSNLAHFVATPNYTARPAVRYSGVGNLALESGGKDSLLVSALMNEAGIKYTPWYLSSSPEGEHPAVIDNLFDELVRSKASIAIRELDLEHLRQSGGFNGHVPITYITQSLALIQAILNNQNTVITSIAQEGGEPHSIISSSGQILSPNTDTSTMPAALKVNHQWSKTWEAEQLFAEYVEKYISPDLHVGSPIRRFSELRVAELFIRKCWQKYGYSFSSCNNANYRQGNSNKSLRWCSNCAKCANTYLLFCPFLPPQNLQALFADKDLFAIKELEDTFKGLLGVDGVLKPFECVGTIDELRFAYQSRSLVPFQTDPNLKNQMLASKQPLPPHYADLPFPVPRSSFNYAAEYPQQQYFTDFLRKQDPEA